MLASESDEQTVRTAEQMSRHFVLTPLEVWYSTDDSMMHPADDVCKHGKLDDFSDFPFESYFLRVKRSIRERIIFWFQLHRPLSEVLASATMEKTTSGVLCFPAVLINTTVKHKTSAQDTRQQQNNNPAN